MQDSSLGNESQELHQPLISRDHQNEAESVAGPTCSGANGLLLEKVVAASSSSSLPKPHTAPAANNGGFAGPSIVEDQKRLVLALSGFEGMLRSRGSFGSANRIFLNLIILDFLKLDFFESRYPGLLETVDSLPRLCAKGDSDPVSQVVWLTCCIALA
jgi:hypothetical protein